MARGGEHAWTYRGQVVPEHERVEVYAEVTEADDNAQRLRADGLLRADGRVIYRMEGFSVSRSDVE